MEQPKLYIPIPLPALTHAAGILQRQGIRIHDTAEGSDFLLYPCPTPLSAMDDYFHGATVVGGNLDFLNSCVSRIDLLKDPYFVASNAAITAEAALGMILSHLTCAVTEAEILILGWGRIGKNLTHQLKHLNAPLTVFARKQEDRAMLRSLSYTPITLDALPEVLPRFRCIVNTAPAEILTPEMANLIRADCFCLDLASVRSIPGENVLHARGLPGRYKTESSGRLIADTLLRHIGGV